MKNFILFLAIILSFQLITAGAAPQETVLTKIIQDVDYEGTNTSVTGTSKCEAGFAEVRAIGTLSDGSDNHAYFMGIDSAASADGNRYLQITMPASEGKIVIEGDLYLSSLNTFNNTILLYWNNSAGARKNTPVKGEYDEDESKAYLGGKEIKIGEFNYFKYEFDIENSTLTSYYNEDTTGTTVTLNNGGTLASTLYVRIQPSYSIAKPGYFVLDNLKITSYEAQGEIASVNGGEDAPYDSTSLSFEMTKLPANLKAEHIKLTGGSVDLTATAITTSENTVTATLSGKLESATEYTVEISKNAYILNSKTDTANDITATFDTTMSTVDIRKPTFTPAQNGEIEISTFISNMEAGDKDVTLIAVTYETDSNGVKRIIDIDAKSHTVPENSTNVPVSVDGVAMSAGRSVKMYVINGWTGKTPMFGKSWLADYDEIN